MKFSVAFLLLSIGLWFAPEIRAQSNTNVVVAFTTTNSTSLNIGFAGFTTELLGKGEEYGDTNIQRYAAMLSPGWLLFPAGTTGDAFNWQTGLTDTNWVNTIGLMEGPNNSASNLTAGTVLALQGKGGAWFTNFVSMADDLGGAKIIVCINAFTDTNPADAGAFAAYALSHHIHVSAWELCNEPYLFQGAGDFFTNGTDYADKMLPYSNAIKAADSNADIAVFFSDPSRTGMSWDNDLARYGATNQYWDSVVYHYYPQLPTNVPFADLMAMDNSFLFSNSTLYVSNILVADSTKTNTTFLLTEFNAALGDGNGGQNPPTTTLYGGIYAAEMVLRLSTCPQMIFAGSYQLVDNSGVATTNDFWNAVTKAATNNYVTNTVGLPFGYFLSAQGSAEAVAYWAINRSTAVFPTSVGDNGPVVPMDTNSNTTMPAIYAQAYNGDNGRRYVVLTNKGSNAVPVQITQDSAAMTNQFLETLVDGSDPSAVNSNPPTNNIVFQTNTVTNPVMIPEFSVVRLEWTVSNVPSPVLAMTVSGTAQNLQWFGQTNVVYNVQAATNLLGSWTTLNRIANGQTNFAFTNYSSSLQQFYRLAVP
ncbi:MAG TPA: hypothetical protein VED19_01640 [Candidatus Nitrosopolaris sp.]|nr:hypothetical protein [Candidatus Nitrosopolaris sp.]